MKKNLFLAFIACVIGAVAFLSSCKGTPEDDRPETYAIDISSNNAEWGSAEARIGNDIVSKAEEGETVRITATAQTGYVFARWQVEGDAIQLGGDPSTTFRMPSRAVTITAVFEDDDPEAPKHAIDVDAPEHATITVKVGGTLVDEAEEGKIVDISIDTDEGYELEKWELAATDSGDDLNDLLNDDSAYATSFRMPAVAVTISAVIVPTTPGTYSIAIDNGGNGAVTITTYEEDDTTVAETSTDGSLHEILEGTRVKIEAIADPHFTFGEWTDASGYIPATVTAGTLTFDMPGTDVSMKANFVTKPKKALTWSATNGSISVSVGGVPVSSGGQVEVGAIVDITANPASTWKFSQWTGQISFADKNANPTTFEMPIFDSSFGVTFVPQTAMLTIIQPAQGNVITIKVNGTAVASGSQVEWNKSVQVVASGFPAGYKFGEWSASHALGNVSFDNKSAEETTFQMPSGDVTLTCTLNESVTVDPGKYVEIGGVRWAKYNLAGNNAFVANETDPGLLYQAGVNVGFAKGVDNAAANAIPTPAGQPFRSSANYSSTAPTPSWITQNPCPEGWSVPTRTDYEALVGAAACVVNGDSTLMTFTDNSDATKVLQLPMPGSFSGWSSSAPPPYTAGTSGYWTTTGQGYAGNFYYFTHAYGGPNTNQSAEPYKAFSIRCVVK